MKPIFIFLLQGVWYARRPRDSDWLELFGTDVLPTPFLAETPVAEVVAELRRNNPGFDVVAVNE